MFKKIPLLLVKLTILFGGLGGLAGASKINKADGCNKNLSRPSGYNFSKVLQSNNKKKVILIARQPGKSKKPVPVIFDSDIGPDYDDVGAIALLHAMADIGECKILATIASNKHKRIAAVLDVMNTYFDRPDIPIGVVHGYAVNMEAPQKWDSLIVSKYPHDIKNNEQADDALRLYRKILAQQPDKSVTIVTVGFLTNMANLLQSGGDEFSTLTGKELVAKKVKQLVCMAARFDSEMGIYKEFNVVKDSISSKMVFDNWPTPILFSGFEIGMKIFTGLAIVNSTISNSPVKDVFARSIPLDPNDKNGRMSWDETAVLVAVRGYKKYFDVVKGKIICNVNGSNSWDKKGKRDCYLVQKMAVAEIEKVIDDLIMHQPVK
jgi:inosine-uridine nucleoside N-ribohydrolase